LGVIVAGLPIFISAGFVAVKFVHRSPSRETTKNVFKQHLTPSEPCEPLSRKFSLPSVTRDATPGVRSDFYRFNRMPEAVTHYSMCRFVKRDLFLFNGYIHGSKKAERATPTDDKATRPLGLVLCQ
jgi:hypothetical protein